MTVASSLRKFRSSSRVVSRARGGVITLSTPTLEQNVVPGRTRVNGSVTVSNSALQMYLDPDACNPFDFDPRRGLSTTITVYVDGQERFSETKCVPGFSGTQDYAFDFIAPNTPGTHQVRVVAKGAESGNTFAEKTSTLTVEQDAPRPDETNPTCNSLGDVLRTQGCGFGDVFPQLGGTRVALGAVGVLFAIVLIAVLAP